ncbi:MAG: MMPL family transporter [Acidimicrobiia bacterium]
MASTTETKPTVAPVAPRTSVLARLAGACYDHRRAVTAAWVLALIVLSVLGQVFGGALEKSFSLPASESSRAFELLKTDFARPGDTGQIVFAVKNGQTLQSPGVQQQVEAVIAKFAQQPDVKSVSDPYQPFNARLIAPNQQVAIAEILFDKRGNELSKDLTAKLRTLAKQSNTSTVQVELGGYMFTQQTMPVSEVIGLAAAVVILLVAFGSLLAMGLPIGTALVGIGIGLALEELLAHIVSIPEFAPQVAAMLGIGVGIDYALFIVTRYRHGLHDGMEPRDAVVTALDTAGRAVIFAGCTVVISMMGLFVIGLGFIQGMAVGVTAVVLVVMGASVTFLPALLGFSGHAIDKFSLKSARQSTSEIVEDSVWSKWSRTLQRRPWTAAIAGFSVLVLLSIPVFALRLGVSDSGNDPESFTTRRAYDLVAKNFGPGANGALLIVGELKSPGDVSVMNRLADELGTVPDVQAHSPAITAPNGKAALIQVTPKGAPQDASTTELVHRLRDKTVPAAVNGAKVSVYVGGATAVGVDLADQIGQRLPWFFAAVLFMSFVLLMLVFRSLLVPLKAVIMNLLSIGAAYGVLIAIFQWGWGKELIGVGREGPIEAWAPMMLFAIVFGLSMDYEVFLLSRIKEEYDRTGDNAEAVAHGVAVTARLITAAAAIMICVFGSFVLSDLRVLKMIGLGLAVAVFIDATVVRLVLVPATMELLGDRNWWFPSWLEWLPKFHVEGIEDDIDEIDPHEAAAHV